MLDLFAAIQSVDPPSLVLWGMFALAAGMYPIGFMLGSTCSPCCSPCACATGELPDTVTVTFDGFTDQTPGPDLITLGISSCFGGGASARVTAPGGDPETDKGPIAGVSLTNGGSGYAKLGRVAPTLTVSGGSGTGATFTPTLTSANDGCGIPTWSLTSVAVSGGSGYVGGEALTITVAEGDTEVVTATAVIDTTPAEPAVTASVSGGTGATLAVTLEESGSGYWYVWEVAVIDGGTGYTDGDSVTFTPGAGTTADGDASAIVYVGRTEPTVTASATGGTGADLSVTLLQETDEFGDTFWTVASVAVIDGGTGYTDGDPVTFDVTDGTSQFPAIGYIVVTDGVITAVDVPYSPYYPYESGYYYKSTGVIESVVMFGGGSYYSETGTPSGVTITNGGQYYREDASEPPYVADITISISQQGPSDGTGAEITATVDDDTSSSTFGQITGLQIENGGTGYLAWKWVANACCGWQLNGMPIVLKRGRAGTISRGPIFPGSECVYSHEICGGWYAAPWGARSTGAMQIQVLYGGPSVAPYVVIGSFGSSSENTPGPACGVALQSQTLVSDCSSMSFTATPVSGPVGVTATVTAGGDYDENFKGKHGSASVPYTRCTQCCQGADDIPQEIEVYVEHNRYRYLAGPRQGAEPETFLTGTYVLPGNINSQSWGLTIPLTETGSELFSIGISISPDLCGSGETNTGWIDGCDNCVKKCAIFGGCAIYRYPSVWYYPPDQDMRYCRIYYDPSLTLEERGDMWCQEFCFDVPLCAPPPGMEFSAFLPYQSENFSDEGCPNCCEPNVSEEATIPGSGHINTFKMTVQ